jgi:hypothetical protein
MTQPPDESVSVKNNSIQTKNISAFGLNIRTNIMKIGKPWQGGP